MSNPKPTLDELIALLREALADPGKARESVKRFQMLVFPHKGEIVSPEINETLRCLAYDLDFFEPDPQERVRGGYYGEERLVELIQEGLRELEK